MSEEVDPQIRLHQILYKRRCAAWAFHFYSTRLGVGRKLVGQQKVFILEDFYFILFKILFFSKRLYFCPFHLKLFDSFGGLR